MQDKKSNNSIIVGKLKGMKAEHGPKRIQCVTMIPKAVCKHLFSVDFEYV